MNRDELIKYFNFEDVIYQDPNYEPYETDPYQLLDIMEQLDKWLFSEERPDKIIEYYKLGDEIENKVFSFTQIIA